MAKAQPKPSTLARERGRLATGFKRVEEEGAPGFRLGEYPLTLWLLSSVILIYLYIARTRALGAGGKGVVRGGNEMSDFGHPGVFTPVKPTVILPPDGATWQGHIVPQIRTGTTQAPDGPPILPPIW